MFAALKRKMLKPFLVLEREIGATRTETGTIGALLTTLKHDLISEAKVVEQRQKEAITELSTSLAGEIEGLKREVARVKQGTEGLRQETEGLRQGMEGLRQEIGGLRQELESAKRDLIREIGNGGHRQTLALCKLEALMTQGDMELTSAFGGDHGLMPLGLGGRGASEILDKGIAAPADRKPSVKHTKFHTG